jgi:hypothetical protein
MLNLKNQTISSQTEKQEGSAVRKYMCNCLGLGMKGIMRREKNKAKE